jgi:hypothetical protein
MIYAFMLPLPGDIQMPGRSSPQPFPEAGTRVWASCGAPQTDGDK